MYSDRDRCGPPPTEERDRDRSIDEGLYTEPSPRGVAMYSCEPRRSRVCNAYQPCSMWPLLGPARHIPLLAIAIDRRDQVSGYVLQR